MDKLIQFVLGSDMVNKHRATDVTQFVMLVKWLDAIRTWCQDAVPQDIRFKLVGIVNHLGSAHPAFMQLIMVWDGSVANTSSCTTDDCKVKLYSQRLDQP